MQCPSNTACSKPFGKAVQNSERSAADSTAFRGARTVFTDTNDVRSAGHMPLPPKFNSHTDYLRWKRVTAQLYN
jgi:hypothetical protein